MCGGTPLRIRLILTAIGLSPRVRGNRPPFSVPFHRHRSIPACAGEPHVKLRATIWVPVYPRVCGGTTPTGPNQTQGQGLSPRVRGNHQPDLPAPGRVGSIPACAGEPAPESRDSGALPVYPRVCGGTSDEGYQRPDHGGLSPRVRGNPGRRTARPEHHRSIPACAGEPLPESTRWKSGSVYPRVCGGTGQSNVCQCSG